MPTPITGFEVRTDMVRGVRVVTVSGEVDIASKADLAAALAATGDRLLVDLSAVTFMESAGLAALVAARHAVNGHGERLAIVCLPGGRVRRLLDLTGVDELFVTYPSREQALEALVSS